MANFDTMLKFFTPDSDVVTIACEDCGKVFDVLQKQKGRIHKCDDCQKESRRRKGKATYVALDMRSVGEPSLDLALAVIRQAKYEAHRGSYEAKEYLEAEDGAQLLLRVAGIPLDEDTLEQFKTLGYRNG